MDKVLRLIGLAKRGGNLEAGEEPVGSAARARDARVILLAQDAAENTSRRVRHFADAGQCIWLSIPCGKDELGRSIGRTSCAMVAVTDLGLASAIVQRLAELSPQTYASAAERMALKAQRAEERRAEAARHEKNLRSGKKKHPAPPARDTAAVEGKPSHGEGAAHGGKPRAKRSHAARHGKPRHVKSSTERFAHSRPVKKGKGSVKK